MTDTTDQSPVFSTNVTLLKTDSSFVSGAGSDESSAITLSEVIIQARSVIHKADRTLVIPIETQATNTVSELFSDISGNISMVQAESYVYAEYQLKHGKWGYMANLAGERFYFHSSRGVARNAPTEHYTLLPAARLTFAPNSDWNFRYSANLQNTIPSLAYLNDVEQQIDPLQLRRGNPDLQSFRTLAQSLNAGYNKKTGRCW